MEPPTHLRRNHMNHKPTDPHCRHGVPYYKDCEECELDMIRRVADQRMPERGLWAEGIWRQIGDDDERG
jgi:hypothetical protein